MQLSLTQKLCYPKDYTLSSLTDDDHRHAQQMSGNHANFRSFYKKATEKHILKLLFYIFNNIIVVYYKKNHFCEK